MHNIPVLILLGVLLIFWKKEIVLGLAFITAGLAYILRLVVTSCITGFQWYYLSWSLIIAGPAFIIGILFILGWLKKKK